VAARAGQGITRGLSYQVSDDLQAGSLTRIMPTLEPPAIPIHLVTSSGSQKLPKVSFLDYVAAYFAKLNVIRPMKQK